MTKTISNQSEGVGLFRQLYLSVWRVRNRRGASLEGSSFSGLFTRVEIGHIHFRAEIAASTRIASYNQTAPLLRSLILIVLLTCRICQCRIPATKRETLVRFLPQTAKPESLRRNTPETGVRYILINKFSEAVTHFGVRIGMDVMLSDSRHWLEYDSVALAVLLAGMGFVELIVLSI